MRAIYNGCLQKGTFAQKWKKALVIPITKPGKTESEEASKFLPHKSTGHRWEGSGKDINQ